MYSVILPPNCKHFTHMDTSKSIVAAIVLALLPVQLHAGLADGDRSRIFQFGLFPPVSSNGTGAGKTENAVSINLIGGYSAGNRIFEFGSFWNASRNYTGGLQLAGLLNYSGYSHNSVQISGFANISASGDSPLQLSGLVNVGDNVSGLQLSALVNVAKTVKGVQVGLVNYMENGEEGVSLGLVNIARHGGKYEFEISFSEAVNTCLSFRLGTDRFYTIFSGGVNYICSPVEYAAGLGFGTDIKWKKRWSSQIEIQAFGISRDKKLTGNSVNSIIQLRLPVCKEFSKHFKIFFGLTVNAGLQNTGGEDSTPPALSPWTMCEVRRNNLLATWWPGLSAGFRF